MTAAKLKNYTITALQNLLDALATGEFAKIIKDKQISELQNVQADWSESTSTSYAYIQNKPTLGSGASLDVPSTAGDRASNQQLVRGDDPRLSDARDPKSHTHTLSEITDSRTAASKNWTDIISPNVNTVGNDLPTSKAVHDAIASAISSIYKPSGPTTLAALNSDHETILVEANVGKVFTLSAGGDVSEYFVEYDSTKAVDAQVEAVAGDSVLVAEISNGVYKYVLLAGFLNMNDYQQKSLSTAIESVNSVEAALTALSANKAAKASGATAGHLAALDANGNLVDAGILATKVNGSDISADDYNTASTYTAGDYCLYNNKLYVCATAAGNEVFDSTKWDEASLIDGVRYSILTSYDITLPTIPLFVNNHAGIALYISANADVSISFSDTTISWLVEQPTSTEIASGSSKALFILDGKLSLVDIVE